MYRLVMAQVLYNCKTKQFYLPEHNHNHHIRSTNLALENYNHCCCLMEFRSVHLLFPSYLNSKSSSSRGKSTVFTHHRCSSLDISADTRIVGTKQLPDLPMVPSQLAASVLKDHLYVLLEAEGPVTFFQTGACQSRRIRLVTIACSSAKDTESITLAVHHDGRGYKLYANINGKQPSIWAFDVNDPTPTWSSLQTLNTPQAFIQSLYPLGQAHLLAITATGATSPLQHYYPRLGCL